MINLNDLTEEQRRALKEEALEEHKQEEQRKRNERKAYKELVSEKVDAIFPSLRNMSCELAKLKSDVYEEFGDAIQLKNQVFGIPASQNSHTFTNAESNRRITLGYHVADCYDDTYIAGEERIKKFISSLGKDEESTMLVDAVLKLLAKDAKGNFKPGRVMLLRQLAERSGAEEFIEGVRIIEEAYNPQRTKTYVRAEYKNDKGAWVNVPLGLTEA